MFEDAIKVGAENINVLTEETIEDVVTPRMKLELDDLIKIDTEIKSKYSAAIPENTAFFPSKTGGPQNFFEMTDGPKRTLLSERYRNITEMPKNNLVFSVKGSGLWNWTSKNKKQFYDNKGNTRQFPILMTQEPKYTSHEMWGGIDSGFAAREYINALILNALIKRHELPQSTYYPLSIVKPKEFPIMENGNLKLCTPEQYADTRFKNTYPKFTIPKEDDINNIVQYIYTGNLVGLRVPPDNFEKKGQQYSSAGFFKNQKMSVAEKWNHIEKFTKNVGSLVKIVHAYGGTFTLNTDHGKLSSLEKSNVSLAGIVCDLDTLDFYDTSTESQYYDIQIAQDTVANYANLFEDTNNKFDYAKHARDLLVTYTGKPSIIKQKLFSYFTSQKNRIDKPAIIK